MTNSPVFPSFLTCLRKSKMPEVLQTQAAASAMPLLSASLLLKIVLVFLYTCGGTRSGQRVAFFTRKCRYIRRAHAAVCVFTTLFSRALRYCKSEREKEGVFWRDQTGRRKRRKAFIPFCSQEKLNSCCCALLFFSPTTVYRSQVRETLFIHACQ